MIRVVTDGMKRNGHSGMTAYDEHRYREFARARLSMEDGHGDVFELYLDDSGNLELKQLPKYNEGGESRVLYKSTADERQAPARFVMVDDANAPGNTMEYEYQLWRHRQSGESYAVRMLPYVPADQRGEIAGTLADQRYEASLIDAACGPVTCSIPALTTSTLADNSADLNYSRNDVGWLREHHMEFDRVDAMSSDVCLLCGARHEQ